MPDLTALTRLVRRVALVSALGAGLFTSASSANVVRAAAALTLLQQGAGAGAQQPPADPTLIRSRYMAIALDSLPSAEQVAADQGAGRGARLVLNLFDDVSVVAVFERFDPNPRGVTWVGRVEGVEGSTVTLVYGGGLMTGNVLTPTATYTIRPAPEAVRNAAPPASGVPHVVSEIDQSRLPPGAPPIEPRIPEADSRPNFGVVPSFDAGEITIDVLVVYTQSAIHQVGGVPALLDLIDLNVSETNTSYAISGVTQRLRLVHTAQVSYSDVSSMDTNLTHLAQGQAGLEGVAALRNLYAADVVTLVHETEPSYCGMAYLMNTPEAWFESSAFSVVRAWCLDLSTRTFAHELGHNMGLNHDWYMSSGTTPYSYAHGHVSTTEGHRWYTIMAYPNLCSIQGFNCQPLLRWSNPDILLSGVPTGIPEGTSSSCTAGSFTANTCDADERLTLNKTASIVAAFRHALDSPGAFSKSAPANAVRLTGLSVSLSWQTSAGATSYAYCYDTIDNGACDGTWVSTGSTSGATVHGLSLATIYYWQVRASNASGVTLANGGAWWSFDTLAVEGAALYDAGIKAPMCGAVGRLCHSDNLLVGRGVMAGHVEPNHPNTIHASCSDGFSTSTLTPPLAIDRLLVRTEDGAPFAPGRTVRVDAVIRSFHPSTDSLHLYYTATANAPAWTYLTTLTPAASGVQTLSATYALPAGGLQAIRAHLSYFEDEPSPCQTLAFDDHDDLVFAVGATPTSNVIQNGAFTGDATGWLHHATPTLSYVVSNVFGGVLQFYRVPPPSGQTNQAVVFQETGLPLPAGAPISAQFDLGNSDNVRKRISVLIHDSNFSDLSVCTFWLPAHAPLVTYAMRTHTTKAWGNTTISFYAATAGSNGGFYRIDNVSLSYAPSQSATEIVCVDPTAPAPPGGAASQDLLVNGDFGTGTLTPWGLHGTIAQQIASGVFEFIRPTAVAPSGVLLQATGQPMTTGQILTTTFQLGNSSTVRKRVTVLLHDDDFSDLSACTFWLAPGQPLSSYTHRTFATRPWTNATLSIYPATIGTEQWIRLDNVSLRRTPGTAVSGTECLAP